MTPLRLVTPERITRAEQLIRETKRSLIEIGLDVGYKNPSNFAQVFRRVVADEVLFPRSHTPVWERTCP